MNLKELIDLVNTEKRNKELIKVARNLAVGMGVAAGLGVATGVLCTLKFVKERREDLRKNRRHCRSHRGYN